MSALKYSTLLCIKRITVEKLYGQTLFNFIETDETRNYMWQIKMKLEQLEPLHSELPPATPWLPILVIHIKSKQDKVKATKMKKIAKNSNF